MGTSHRHKPSIYGQPNWGKTSSSITKVSIAVDESDKLENNPPSSLSPSQIVKKQASYGKRIRTNYQRAIRNYVRAAGGRSKVSSGASKSLGHAGVAVASSFFGLISDIAQNGLSSWLNKHGYGSLGGRSYQEILTIIKSYTSCDVAGLDNTAANEAVEAIWELIAAKMEYENKSFDDIMKQVTQPDSVKELLDVYFGTYIYSHLSQNFAEKIEYEKGTEVMLSTMETIKEQILDDVRRDKLGAPSCDIDWNSPEGEKYIQKEFDKVLFILSGNED